jgi:hypothetical protein
MKAGDSNFDVGSRIKITKISREEEQHLVGHTGILTHPFPYFDVEYVGVYLDRPDLYLSNICNLSVDDDFESIE